MQLLYIVVGVVVLIVIAIALYSIFGSTSDQEEIDRLNQFLADSQTESNTTLTQQQLDNLNSQGLVLMKRSSTSDEMGYTTRYNRRSNRYRYDDYMTRTGWPARRWYFPYFNYDIWNPYYYWYRNQYCWVRGYDGDYYAIRYVNGRCPLDLLR